MILKKFLFVVIIEMSLITSGFAATEARDVLTEYEAQARALKGNLHNTGLTSVEAWFTNLGGMKRKTGNALLAIQKDLETALEGFARFKAKETGIAYAGEETELTGTVGDAFDALSMASVAAILAGNPRGAVIYVLCADYLTTKGKPDAFTVLYQQLTDAATAWLDSMSGLNERARTFTQTMLTDHAAEMRGKDTNHRLLHMALKG